MDLDRVRVFAERHHRAVLATRTPSGGVQQSPVLVAVDDAGRFCVSSRETAYKTKNLRADGWAQLCVFTDAFFGTWYYVEGTTEVLSLPDAMEPLVDYYRRAAGEHDDWDSYRAEMEREKRVLLRVTAERAGPDRQG
ncbi:PPOX class F420-dependent oxidoreductase [Nocardioides sp. CFH 31398]|uniref:PPOX class F420-dependent oxidoreductase n=1 Tax=Nocardioides sp. CFH 31398 TaxID=2919579 RepID=UPI001F057854|nr:PPOX class F420-dependent oxidoreductase [Nocardioides sp. CFH 31398]MCH1865779.1 PPOX class F420-dependent oxidoreductase [Nocardioides sp. CFH 31398]